jgi:hypothetical protein
MGYRIERVQGHSRVAYVLYTERMAYLATMSWLNGKLVYEIHVPEIANISARDFEDDVKALDTVQS